MLFYPIEENVSILFVLGLFLDLFFLLVWKIYTFFVIIFHKYLIEKKIICLFFKSFRSLF